VRIPIRLTLYIIYQAPIFSPPQLLSKSLTEIANGFLVLFCKGIWSSSTKYYHLNLLSSPPPTRTATHTVPILQTWFSLLIFKLMFKKVSKCMPTVGVIYFGPFNPTQYSHFPLCLPPPVCVGMFCLLMRLRFWNLPLLCCLDLSVPSNSKVFVLWICNDVQCM
jgi:hypothetical protein